MPAPTRAASRPRAERRDGGWLINGRKAFISNAGTDMSFGVDAAGPDGPAGRDGDPAEFASFVVEKGTPGYTLGPKMRGIGWRGLDTRELYFDDVWVADDHLVGDPALGLGQFLSTLEVGRISIAALSLSLTQAVLDMATRLCPAAHSSSASRSRSSRPCSSSWRTSPPSSRRPVGSRTVPRQLRDAGQPFLKEASMAKLKASRVAAGQPPRRCRSTAASATCSRSPVARFYCDAKVLEIGEGTNEIQHLVIARELGC